METIDQVCPDDGVGEIKAQLMGRRPSNVSNFLAKIAQGVRGLFAAEHNMLSVNHRERQLMQQLRDRGWVNAVELPQAAVTLERLLERCWIEKRGAGSALAYRITDKGIEAKTAPVRVSTRRTQPVSAPPLEPFAPDCRSQRHAGAFSLF